MHFDLWHKNAVVYSLDVETFLDSDGDGCGDFAGLIRRLDYLEGLGVNAVWLAPFQPTPNRDNGYDVSDYYGVDRRLGSPGDFVEFVHDAASRGIRVLIDLVVNHTSDQHRWFREARKGESSPYYDWYVWSKKRPRDWKTGIVFPGVQETTWTYAKKARAYYFHRFYDFEPDLNMANPSVRAEVQRIIGYWLELGVAGFRVDAVPFILEKPAPQAGKPKLEFGYLNEMRDFLQWRAGNAVLLGEANVEPGESQKYFAAGDGLHMMFDFWVNQHLFYALASGEVRPLAEALRSTRRIPAAAQWAHFLRNHDELDVGRLSDEQRATIFEQFGPEPAMQLYGRGIRRRLSPMLGDRRKLELAYSVMFSLPGTPVIRYGEEIGMGEDLSLAEREAVRTPMQWSGAPNGGFTDAERPVRPVVSGGIYGFENVNVEAQRRDPESLLLWMTRIIRLRKECPEIGWGQWKILPTRTPSVLAIAYQLEGSTLVCAHNLDGVATEISLRLDVDASSLTNLMLDEDIYPDARGRYGITLEAFGYGWYRAGPAREALRP